MKPQLLILVVAVGAGAWLVMSDMKSPAESAPAAPTVRVVAGGAKFVKTNNGNTRTGSQQPAKKMPTGVVNLMSKKSPPTNGLGLSDLKARQENEANGYVTQRNGSASLPRHNDVPRMDGMVME